MSSFSNIGGRIAKTRYTQYPEIYNSLRKEYQLNPAAASYFFPPPLSSVCKNGAKNNCFIQPKPVINPSTNPPTPRRLSNIINNSKYFSKVQYANASSGTPFYVNYLGRTPGQPGGGGKPPTNRLQ